jgi:hypothetical protein
VSLGALLKNKILTYLQGGLEQLLVSAGQLVKSKMRGIVSFQSISQVDLQTNEDRSMSSWDPICHSYHD